MKPAKGQIRLSIRLARSGALALLVVLIQCQGSCGSGNNDHPHAIKSSESTEEVSAEEFRNALQSVSFTDSGYNPVAFHRACMVLRGAQSGDAIIAIDPLFESSRARGSNAIPAIVCALFSRGDDSWPPPLLGDLTRAQTAIRSEFPQYPMLLIGGLFYFLPSMPQKVDAGDQIPQHTLQYTSPREFTQWAGRSGILMMPPLPPKNPILSVSQYLESLSEDSEGALRMSSGPLVDYVKSRLRIQALNALEGVLWQRITEVTGVDPGEGQLVSDEAWRVIHVLAIESGLYWDPVQSAFEVD